MPFEDQAKEDVAEVELPATLVALGDRLGAEAEALARRYPASAAAYERALEHVVAGMPADSGANPKAADNQSSHDVWPAAVGAEGRRAIRRPAGWWAAAASVAAMVLLAIVAWRGGGREGAVVQRGGHESSANVDEGDTRLGAQRGGESGLAEPVGQPANSLYVRQNLLQGLSGPEREAVLDLLETQRGVNLSL
jgi:hypothetical protein